MTERVVAQRGPGQRTVQHDRAPAYSGTLGATRTEPHALWMPNGSHRIVDVWVSVNAETDPELAELARAGTLHALDGGEPLAVPFVYHDPQIPWFGLVVPSALRHRTLQLRAELLTALAADTGCDVPAYVADARVVVGPSGLLAALRPRFEDAATVEDGELDELDAPEPLDLQDVREVLDDAEEGDDALAAEPLAVAELVDDVGALVVVDAQSAESVAPEPMTRDTPSLAGAAYARPSDVEALEPSVLPSSGFELGPSQALLAGDDAQTWLYVRGPSALRSSVELDVLLQRAPGRGPYLVLSVVIDAPGAPELRRGVVEPQRPEQRALLERMALNFELELAALSSDGEPLHWGTLYAPREANVRDLLAWFARAHPDAEPLSVEAQRRALESAPPWRDLGHPFQPKALPADPIDAIDAAVALDELALWLTPEKLEHLRLDLCVSDELIELRVRETLEQALDAGLALDPSLRQRAVALGVAADERALFARRLAGLCRTSAAVDHGGLSGAVLRTLWAEVLEEAPRLGIALTQDVERVAALHAGDRALEHARALAPPVDDTLAPLRERFQRGEREPALLSALAMRGGVHDLVALLTATSEGQAEAFGRMVAEVAARGGVIPLDAARALFGQAEALPLRAAAAALMASLRATAHLPELVAALAEVPEPEARVLAWCIGRYGVGSFRAVCRVLADTALPREREAWVLAALVAHGARAQVRARARSRSTPEAQLAAHALELANQLKETGNPFVGLEQQGALTVFFDSFDRARQYAAEHGTGGSIGVGVDSAGAVP